MAVGGPRIVVFALGAEVYGRESGGVGDGSLGGKLYRAHCMAFGGEGDDTRAWGEDGGGGEEEEVGKKEVADVVDGELSFDSFGRWGEGVDGHDTGIVE